MSYASDRPFRYVLLVALAGVVGCSKTEDSATDDSVVADTDVAKTYTIGLDSLPGDVEIGEAVQLTALIFEGGGSDPSDLQASWTSSDPSVLSVDSTGLATGVGAGQATITATYGDASDEGAITVVDPCAPVATLTYGGASLDQTVELAAGRCTSRTGGYATNIKLVVPEKRSFIFRPIGNDALVLLHDADDDEIAAISGFPVTRRTLEVGTYRLEVTTNAPDVEGSVSIGVVDACTETGGLGFDTTGNPATGTFSIGDGDCYDTASGMYAFDFYFYTNANSVSGRSTLSVTFDRPITRSRMVVDTRSGLTDTESAGTTIGWAGDYNGSYLVTAHVWVSEPITGSAKVTR